MYKKILLLSFILCLHIGALAKGLQLFSYRDDSGRRYIVDSIEKIPAKYRNQVKKGFIQGFNDEKKVKPINKKNIQSYESTAEIIEPISLSSENVTEEKLKSEELDEEIKSVEYEAASCSVLIEKLEKIKQNNEKVYAIAVRFSPSKPGIIFLNNENLRDINNLFEEEYKPKSFAAWAKEAHKTIGRFRLIQLKIANWAKVSDDKLKRDIKLYIGQMKYDIDLLKSKLQAEKKKLLEELKSSDK